VAATARAGLHQAAFLCCIEVPEAMADWSLTILQLKLIKICARVVRHAGAITIQLAEVAVTGPIVRAVLAAIRRLRAPPSCALQRSRLKLNESGRTGLPAALENTVSDPEQCRFAVRSPCPISPPDRRHRSGLTMLVQRSDSGDLHVSRHATWGISDDSYLAPSYEEAGERCITSYSCRIPKGTIKGDFNDWRDQPVSPGPVKID
jgi:hypothetical protein